MYSYSVCRRAGTDWGVVGGSGRRSDCTLFQALTGIFFPLGRLLVTFFVVLLACDCRADVGFDPLGFSGAFDLKWYVAGTVPSAALVPAWTD